MNDYVEKAMRTDAPLTAELIHRLTDPTVIRLLHAAMGLTTESGELVDMLKKHIFANKPLDLVNAKEEVGDSLWYAAMAIDVLQTTMNEIKSMNIDKLKLRYPDKFSTEHSSDRDVVSERELMENHSVKEVGISLRGQDWQRFSDLVLPHIEDYTVTQYGDKGDDRASEYSLTEIKEHIGRYRDRIGSGSRGNKEQKRDFLKIAHYASFGFDLVK